MKCRVHEHVPLPPVFAQDDQFELDIAREGAVPHVRDQNAFDPPELTGTRARLAASFRRDQKGIAIEA